MRILFPGIALLFLVSCASTGSAPKEEVVGQPDTVADRLARNTAAGKELWSRCQACHGRDGRAQTAFGASLEIPDFTTKEWRRSRGATQLIAAITEGCGARTASGGSRMPAQGEKLSEGDIRSLVAYIRFLGS